MATNVENTQKRKVADCRDFPSEMNCTLTIAGTEDEVVRAAAEHAVSVHGHQDSAELRTQIRKMLKDEKVPSGEKSEESGQGPLHLIA